MANATARLASGAADTQRRREAMAVLASAETAEIARHLDAIAPLPPYENARPAEIGLIMVRGRIGGDGAPFNVGEAAVSRAAVALSGYPTGFGYVLGRDRAKARLIAVCDALIQTADYAERVERHVLAPIRQRLQQQRERKARQVAATKVEFFTLVRGED